MTEDELAREPRIAVVVPAWNEESTILGVLEELRAAVPTAEVIVVSDGSTDATAALARAHGATVLDLPFNLGVGGAVRAGYKYALRAGHEYVVQIDGDGQHDPAYVHEMLELARRENVDLVIGARFAGQGDYEAGLARRAAMSILSTSLSRVAKTRLTDTTSGFKLAGPRALQLFSREFPAEYLGDTVEALVIAARRGLVIRQIPVTMRPRQGGVASHAPLKAAIFLGRAVMAVSLALTRPMSAWEEK